MGLLCPGNHETSVFTFPLNWKGDQGVKKREKDQSLAKSKRANKHHEVIEKRVN